MPILHAILHAIHLQLLHAALGLSYYVRQPTRDTLPQADERAHLEEVAALVALGYLAPEQYHGEGGTSTSMRITEAGRAIALAHPPAHYNDTAAPTAAPQQPQPRSKSMTTEATARKTRKSAEKTQAPDTRTGDLLAGAAPETPPFDVSVTVADAQPAPLALATLNPVQYVAEVYQPFRAKFDALKTEADAIESLDASTKEGMATAIRLRAAFRDEVRLAATHAHKDRKAPILEIGRLLDAKKNEIIAAVEPYETRFDKAIKDEEERKAREKEERERKEAERVAAIRARIDAITALATVHANDGSAALLQAMEALGERTVTKEEFAELTDEAALAIEATGSALHTLYTGALAREQAEAERIRLAEEERQRIAAEAERQRLEAARLAEERARIEQQQREAEQAAAALKLASEQQQRTMAAVVELTALAGADGDADALGRALKTATDYQVTADLYGAGVHMVTMAQSMALKALEPKLAQAIKDAPPPAPIEEVTQPEVAPEPGFFDGIDESQVVTYMPDGSFQALEAAPAPAAEPAPEPAPLPEPEAYSPIDEQINIGEAVLPGAQDIIELVAGEYDITHEEAALLLAGLFGKAAA